MRLHSPAELTFPHAMNYQRLHAYIYYTKEALVHVFIQDKLPEDAYNINQGRMCPLSIQYHNIHFIVACVTIQHSNY